MENIGIFKIHIYKNKINKNYIIKADIFFINFLKNEAFHKIIQSMLYKLLTN